MGVSLPENKMFIVYTLLLLSANFVGDSALQIFHFSYSAGTLIMQLVFCLIVLFCEQIGQYKTLTLVGVSAILNLVVALAANLMFDLPIPEFWLSPEEESVWRQFNISLIFTLAYVCSALMMVWIFGWLVRLFGNEWLMLRVMVLLTVGFLVDCAILLPILYLLALDRYMALWKMISLASVKGSLSLLASPFTYCSICLLKWREARA